MADSVEIDTVVERKDPSLPRYVEIPSSYIKSWRLEGTTPVDISIDEVELGRRNIKPWGKGRDCWFLNLPKTMCRRAGIDTGDPISLVIRLLPRT